MGGRLVSLMPILEYHGVALRAQTQGERWVRYEQPYDLDRLRVAPEQFSQHLQYLLSLGYRNVSLSEYARSMAGGRHSGTFAVTFDDGYADNYAVAWPILKQFGCTATIFVVADRVESADRGQHRLFLTWDEVQEMAAGGIAIGSHTLTHPDLARLDQPEVRRQVVDSRSLIENRIGRPVDYFSYPYGSFTDAVQDCVRSAGYAGAVVTPVRTGVSQGPFALKRVGLYRHNSRFEVRLKLSPWFAAAREWPPLRRVHLAVNRLAHR